MAILERYDPALHPGDLFNSRTKASLNRATNGEEMKRLVADFNRDWADVTRTREILVLAENSAGVRRSGSATSSGAAKLSLMMCKDDA